MNYRKLTEEEIDQIWSIDRTEYVESVYRYNHGQLEEESLGKNFIGWPLGEDEIYGPLLKDCFRRGGFFWGGFHEGVLKALVVLESKFIGKSGDTLQLKFLHIDRAFRKMGIGKILFDRAVQRAKEMGAKRIYISSCENRNTVEFYKHMGCVITEDVDPQLFALEPEDIHMEYTHLL